MCRGCLVKVPRRSFIHGKSHCKRVHKGCKAESVFFVEARFIPLRYEDLIFTDFSFSCFCFCCFCCYHWKVLLHSPLSFQLFEELRIVPPAGKPYGPWEDGFGDPFFVVLGSWLFMDEWWILMNVWLTLPLLTCFYFLLKETELGNDGMLFFRDCMITSYDTAKEW